MKNVLKKLNIIHKETTNYIDNVFSTVIKQDTTAKHHKIWVTFTDTRGKANIINLLGLYQKPSHSYQNKKN